MTGVQTCALPIYPGKLDYYESIGITEIVLRVEGGDADAVLPVLDEFATLVDR